MQKLLKVNERLYREETQGDGRPLNWLKGLSQLHIRLHDVERVQSFGLNGEATLNLTDDIKDRLQLQKFLERIKSEDTDSVEMQLEAVEESILKKVYTEGKEKQCKRSIRASAVFEDRSINLIKDGEIPSSSKDFSVADFVCYEGEGLGSLGHTDEGSGLEYSKIHSDPYLYIETYLPTELFAQLWDEMADNNLSQMSAYVQVDIYQSEMERSLAEPWMHQTYTIETGSYGNHCGLVWVAIDGKKKLLQSYDNDYLETNPQDVSSDPLQSKTEEEKSVILQKAFLMEIRRTNKLIKWLVISVFLLGFFVLLAGG